MKEEITKFLSELNRWRENKPSIQSRMSAEYWNRIRFLHEKYPQENLKKLFKINSRAWIKNIQKTPSSTNGIEKSFKVVSPPTPMISENNILMKLKLKNGTEVTLYH